MHWGVIQSGPRQRRRASVSVQPAHEMVNYKRVVCDVAVLLLLVAAVTAAPAPEEKHYDQRQNGTENYRLSIDGVVIAIAPADSFLAAASDISDLFDISDLDDIIRPPSSSSDKPVKLKPEPEKPVETSISEVSLNSDLKPQKKDASVRKQEKVKRLKQRLASMLMPLLRKTRNNQ